MFCNNVKNFFKLNNRDNEYRNIIAQPLKGLADVELYNRWKNYDKEKYDEVNNIVYEINVNSNNYHSFKTFARELKGYYFKAIPNLKFPKEALNEQLKLINILLGVQYWIDLSDI
jgi:hypothetical protein